MSFEKYHALRSGRNATSSGYYVGIWKSGLIVIGAAAAQKVGLTEGSSCQLWYDADADTIAIQPCKSHQRGMMRACKHKTLKDTSAVVISGVGIINRFRLHHFKRTQFPFSLNSDGWMILDPKAEGVIKR